MEKERERIVKVPTLPSHYGLKANLVPHVILGREELISVLASVPHYFPLIMPCSKSMGRGKTIVEFFSEAMVVSV